MSLLRVMATTPHGSWPACPAFGFRDLLEHARVRPELRQTVTLEINRALSDLGILSFRVDSIAREAHSDRAVDSYNVTLVSTVDAAEKVVLSV